jgi:ATP-dependent RNA helicase DeaD
MDKENISFSDLGLKSEILKSINSLGYETPSPIQASSIPAILNGSDILGQAQTGTGKTAAFALPLLCGVDTKDKNIQILVLVPTRELAIQVAEAIFKYGKFLKSLHVTPIYGGQDYGVQLRSLSRGSQVVVGTPGRTMDHMRRGTLKLDSLKALVLDEADEMLNMGFLSDVEWVLEQTPSQRQIALFSATMPREIAKIAKKYLNEPEIISIKVKTTTAETIRQRYWMVSGMHKIDALTRILESESFDAMIIFVRTKNITVELANKIESRGFRAVAINGDIAQNTRERSIQRLKSGKVDILVATDVAARGLDVDRISHVINYDIPYDTESYVHRIGRTGRAGKNGDAILFVSPRERNFLFAIEKATRQKIERMKLPSAEVINDKRVENFKTKLTNTLEINGLEKYQKIVEQYQSEHDIPFIEIAAALAKMSGDNDSLFLEDKKERYVEENFESDYQRGRRDNGRRDNGRRDRDRSKSRGRREQREPDSGMDRFKIEVGRKDSVKPGNIVGAIANEIDLDSKNIGKIEILDNHSTVDLPNDLPEKSLSKLRNIWICNKKTNIQKL